ncbi:unnamed protein product [Didymodactylos carnosus]|uniref:Uncharacterized protein n=1 Tax=Didymodactylos carnosus TaxID=1234261 RepID=A0A8S2PKX6_9BILA|nr:unnamed protein product [Didymodactylos carnosus]CAF4051290.1 unnamed protein product [Didymodactylos carnosus]
MQVNLLEKVQSSTFIARSCTTYPLEDETIDGVRTIDSILNNYLASKVATDHDKRLYSSNQDSIDDLYIQLMGRSLSKTSKLQKNNELSSLENLLEERPRSVLWPRICFFAQAERQGSNTKRCFPYEHEQKRN